MLVIEHPPLPSHGLGLHGLFGGSGVVVSKGPNVLP